MNDRRVKLNRCRILLLCLALLCALPGCAVRPKAERNAAGEKLFRLGFAGEGGSVNPYTASTACGETALALMYDTLLTRAPDTDEIGYGLCTAYTVTDSAAGGRLWHMELRSDAVWSDGESVTASDVEFSFQSQSFFSALYYDEISQNIDTVGISVDSDHSLSFVAWGGDAEILDLLARMPILPRHIWNEADGMGFDSRGLPASPARAAAALDAMPVNSKTMVSSGGYAFVSLTEDRLTLRYQHPEVPCEAEAVELIWNLADPASAVEEGRADAVYDAPAGSPMAEGLYGSETASDTVFLLEFNRMGQRSPALADASVRRAISTALDRKSIAALLGAAPSDTLISADAGSAFAPDLQEAAGLLEEAGYKDTAGLGIRRGRTGELTLALSYPDSAGWGRAAEQIQRDLSSVGIRIELCPASAQQQELCRSSGDFDLMLTAAQLDTAFSMFYWNGGAGAFARQDAMGETVFPGWNECYFSSERYEHLYEQMRLAGDEETRSALSEELSRILREESACAVLGHGILSQRCSDAWRFGTRGTLEVPVFAPDTVLGRLRQLRAR